MAPGKAKKQTHGIYPLRDSVPTACTRQHARKQRAGQGAAWQTGKPGKYIHTDGCRRTRHRSHTRASPAAASRGKIATP